MSKKGKGLVLDSMPPYGVGSYEDANSRLRHQALIQDYEELQKEVGVMISKLEAVKQRKLILAAEVRFLRRRRKFLIRTKTTPVFQEQKFVQPPILTEITKNSTGHLVINRKDSGHHRLPPPPDPKHKKKHQIARGITASIPMQDREHPRKKVVHSNRREAIQPNLVPVPGLNHKGRINIRREAFPWNTAPLLELNLKERTHGADTNNTAFRKSIATFDLNQDMTSPRAKESPRPIRAPIFDLNQIVTDDEDLQNGIEAEKLDEAKKSLIRGLNEDQQNDLKLSLCRNAGEGPSRVGKRRISWQDPVALRV